MSEREWSNATPEPGESVSGDGVRLRCLEPAGAMLVSGDPEAAIAALAPGAPLLGLLDEVPEGDFALRIARDRALLCTDAPLEAAPGWHGDYALSAADDLYLVLEIAGREAPALRDACMSAVPGSPSAAVAFGESACLVARRGAAIRVWVPRPEAAALWLRLRRLAGLA